MSTCKQLYRGLAVGFAALTATAFLGGPVLAADNGLKASAANPFDPDGAIIKSAAAGHTYRFAVPVPAGGRLQALSKTGDPSEGVLVLNKTGEAIGAYDLAWAQDAESRPVSTRYRIQGQTLVQEVDFDAATTFPVIFDIAFNEIGVKGAIGVSRVDLPSNYVYNPSLSPTSWHDYCTSSPDEFPNPGGSNASFHGPCARHDMCIQYRWASHQTCNNWLFNDMVENCQYWYSWYNPVRTLCMNTAGVYWAAVTAATVW